MSPPLPLEDMEDLDLIRSAQSGDVIAMSRLLDAMSPYVGRICASIALDAGQDAAQESLIQIFRDLRRLREPQALRSWVRRIATREAVRHAQRDRMAAHRSAPLAELPSESDLARCADVREILRALEPEQRAILVLRDLEGLSEAEAAEQLRVARGTSKSRLHRARMAFRERWNA